MTEGQLDLAGLKAALEARHPLSHEAAGIPDEYAIVPREPFRDLIEAAEENERLREALEIVNEQAEDEGLWFMAETAPEAYLQQGLRRLHAALERKP